MNANLFYVEDLLAGWVFLAPAVLFYRCPVLGVVLAHCERLPAFLIQLEVQDKEVWIPLGVAPVSF